ncbi:MAG: hypothetical protein VXZ67_02125, partial [Pseudomonadota bacterium]|nr:hypothetical protein [Pseudomonadota bacterium]
MRKVLLATTAIVALGGVSAASADISVSGGAEFKYESWGGANSTSANSNKVTNQTKFKISASSVADNGMTLSAYTLQDGSSTGAFNDAGFSIADDWGTLGFWDAESGDAFETNTDITAEEGYNGATNLSGTLKYHPTDSQIGPADVSYLSPNMGGFQFSVGYDDTGAAEDTTMMGGQYAMTAGDAAITLKYAASSKGSATTTGRDGTDATSMGLVVAMSGVTLTLAQNDTEVKATAASGDQDYEASSASIAYTISDAMAVQMYSGETDDKKNTSFKFKDTGYGLTYTITPGLAASVTHNSWDHTDSSGT